MTEVLIAFKTALAQVPPAPSPPDGGDLTTDNQISELGDESQLPQSATPTNIPPPTIQILPTKTVAKLLLEN
jgi:hypothetical protein